MNSQKIYVLLGYKGAGKSYIGRLFESEFNIHFLNVELLAKSIKKERDISDEDYITDVFAAITSYILESMSQYKSVVFESTGLTKQFDSMLHRLKEQYRLISIRVLADEKLCLTRVKERDQSEHVNVSDEQVTMINTMVSEKKLLTDFTIENSNKTRDDLIRELRSIIEN